MYKDAILKVDFYKNYIMKTLAKKGRYAGSDNIQKSIDSIDNLLSIFRYSDVSPGDTFDTDTFNQNFQHIGEDLKIIYSIVDDLCNKEYLSVKEYIDSHLNELEDCAKRYELLAKAEMGNTSLGKTIFFQSNGYSQTINNKTAIISLGAITFKQASRISCLIDIDNISSSDILFNFRNASGSISLNCAPNNYNNSSLLLPGSLVKDTYEFSIDSNQSITTSFPLDPVGLVFNNESSYKVLGAKNKILFTNNSGQSNLVSKSKYSSIATPSSGIIKFVVRGGTYIDFEFSNEPVSRNFSGYGIKNMKSIHEISIGCPESFVFNYKTDGTVYASVENCIAVDNELFYPGSTDARDFLIEETSHGAPLILIASVSILAGDPVINSIAIKELVVLEGA